MAIELTPTIDPSQSAPLQAPALTRNDLTGEFVAGGSLFSTGGTRTLPISSDDLTRELGSQVYEAMLRDPDVEACVMLLVNSVLADGVQINASVDEKDPQFAKAVDVGDFCKYSIEAVKQFRSSLETMLRDALGFGNKVAEQTYALESYTQKPNVKKAGAPTEPKPTSRTSTMLVLKKLKPKPRRTTAFVVDQFMNVLGLAYVAGRGNGTGLSISLDGLKILPRDKFAVLTLRSEDSDPRGTSSLRPAFNAYNLKSLTYPEYLRYLIQYALASVIAKTAEGAVRETMLDETGRPMVYPNGQPVMVSPTDALRVNLERFRNGTYLIVPHGTDINTLKVPGKGDAFLQAFTLFGQEITRAILFQTLATREGQHGTRAESQQKMTVLDMLVWWLKGQVADMIQEDILRPLVRYNFGDEIAKTLTPCVSLGDTERRDWSLDAEAAARLAPLLTDSQWKRVTRQLGIPDPEEGEEKVSRQPTQNAIPSPAPNQSGPATPIDTAKPKPDSTNQPAQPDQQQQKADQQQQKAAAGA